ncbi:MAG: hypothetical protein R3267_07560 [Paenisporosarcina sp.]|nr:hypothetical protein [Paenisporosarcina sp.]
MTKRSKINFFTSSDGTIWINKEQLLTTLEELYQKYQKKKQFYTRLINELEKAKRPEE